MFLTLVENTIAKPSIFQSFKVLHFTFKSMINSESIFVASVRSLSRFFFFFSFRMQISSSYSNICGKDYFPFYCIFAPIKIS